MDVVCDLMGASPFLAGPVRQSGFSVASAKLFGGQCHHKSVGIKHGFVFEHEVNGACDFDRHDCVGLELIASHLRFERLRKRPDDGVVSFGNDGGFAKGPAGRRSCSSLLSAKDPTTLVAIRQFPRESLLARKDGFAMLRTR
jgi:hypothetical protein